MDLSVERPVKYTSLSNSYLNLEVIASTHNRVDWNSVLDEKGGQIHSIELYNTDDKNKEIDLQLFASLKNNLLHNDVLSVLFIRNVALTLENTELLCEALSQARCLQHLSLQDCSLSDNCCKKVCEVLPKVPSVISLDLSQNNITEKGTKWIAKLIKNEEMGRGISCWMNSLRGRPIDKEKVLGISRLTLSDNPIGDEGLGNIVEPLYDDIWLKAIDAQRCEITNDGAKLVLNLLRINQDIQVFDLRDNFRINPYFITAIVKRISRNHRNLINKDSIWISTEKTSSEINVKFVKTEEETEKVSSKSVIEVDKLRRTQSCKDQRVRRETLAHLWKTMSVSELKRNKPNMSTNATMKN